MSEEIAVTEGNELSNKTPQIIPDEQLTSNQLARRYGIPKMLKQYARKHGLSVIDVIAKDNQMKSLP